ncbi:MAG: sialate O-acetylesterase, partial [Planctomycetota bacterium]
LRRANRCGGEWRAGGPLLLILAIMTVSVPLRSARADETAGATEGAGRHLFLLAGQSNMAGRGAIAEEDLEPHPRVFALNAEENWVPAVAPLHFDKPERIGVGLGRSFAIAYAADHPTVEVGLIPCAVGGSPISAWEPGAEYAPLGVKPYDEAIARARVALTSGELKGILWHQGESDCTPEDAPRYAERLNALIARFRADLDAEDVPFLIGQLGQFRDPPWGRLGRQVDGTHRAAAETNAAVRFVSSDGLTDKGDKLHFNADGYREFGRRYYRVWQDVAAATESTNPEKAVAEP